MLVYFLAVYLCMSLNPSPGQQHWENHWKCLTEHHFWKNQGVYGFGLQGRVSQMVACRSTVAHAPSGDPCSTKRRSLGFALVPLDILVLQHWFAHFYRVQVCQNHFGCNCPTWETRIHSDSCPVCVTGAQSCVPESLLGLSAGQLMALRDLRCLSFSTKLSQEGLGFPLTCATFSARAAFVKKKRLEGFKWWFCATQ